MRVVVREREFVLEWPVVASWAAVALGALFVLIAGHVGWRAGLWRQSQDVFLLLAAAAIAWLVPCSIRRAGHDEWHAAYALVDLPILLLLRPELALCAIGAGSLFHINWRRGVAGAQSAWSVAERLIAASAVALLLASQAFAPAPQQAFAFPLGFLAVLLYLALQLGLLSLGQQLWGIVRSSSLPAAMAQVAVACAGGLLLAFYLSLALPPLFQLMPVAVLLFLLIRRPRVVPNRTISAEAGYERSNVVSSRRELLAALRKETGASYASLLGHGTGGQASWSRSAADGVCLLAPEAEYQLAGRVRHLQGELVWRNLPQEAGYLGLPAKGGLLAVPVPGESHRAVLLLYFEEALGVEVEDILASARWAAMGLAATRGGEAFVDTVALEREAERRFVQRMSHELRTPLTTLSGYAEILQMSDLSKERTREMATAILEDAGQLSRVIDHLLELQAANGEKDC